MILTFTGYYGHANAGDDAFVETLKQAFPDARFTAGKFVGDETHVVVGGGEFDTWMVEGAPANAKLYAIGIGVIRSGIGKARAEWLQRMQSIAVRDFDSLELCRAWGIDADVVRPDLTFAARLPEISAALRGEHVIVPSVHHDLDEAPNWREATIVPFWPGDELNVPRGARVWRQPDPLKLIGELCGAASITCWGKLHAAIFAHMMDVPLINLAPDAKYLAFKRVCTVFPRTHLRRLAREGLDLLRQELVLE